VSDFARARRNGTIAAVAEAPIKARRPIIDPPGVIWFNAMTISFRIFLSAGE
jgi:hypothetical protein